MSEVYDTEKNPRTCYRGDGKPKVVFMSRKDAREEAKKLNKAKKWGKLRDYRCWKCTLWHLGHTFEVPDD